MVLAVGVAAVVTSFTMVGADEVMFVPAMLLSSDTEPATERGCEVTMTNFCPPALDGVAGVRGV